MELDPATMLRCIAILCTIELQSVQPVGQPTQGRSYRGFGGFGRTPSRAGKGPPKMDFFSFLFFVLF